MEKRAAARFSCLGEPAGLIWVGQEDEAGCDEIKGNAEQATGKENDAGKRGVSDN
jgi:hypothetical protein